MRVNLHPRTETELWAGSSTRVRNPLPTSALQMLQQPHMCVPIWLCRVGLMEPHCQGFTHHTLLPTSPPPFLSGNTFPPGWTLKDLSSQFKSSANSLHAVPCPYTVQWYHSVFPSDAFVTNIGKHAMLLTENYNASSCKISKMVYNRSHTFLFLILFFISSWIDSCQRCLAFLKETDLQWNLMSVATELGNFIYILKNQFSLFTALGLKKSQQQVREPLQ